MTNNNDHDLYRRFVNPDYVELLEAFDFGRTFVRAKGTKLYDEAGREYTDFLAGYGVHNIGHNHPRVIEALQRVLDSDAPSMLIVDAPHVAARLAERLTDLTSPALCRTSFANSGAEAVEIAIKAVRSATGRNAIIACDNAFHGRTTGALALAGSETPRKGFGALLPGAHHIPFSDAAALDAACRLHRPAAFFVEPIQGEGGVVVPGGDYLKQVAEICRAFGCLLVVDEIQTGVGRTGKNFAVDFKEIAPDVLLVGKALSAGLVPVTAAMMTERIWKRAFSGPERCYMNSSTFARGLLAMTAGLETLNVLKEEGLAARSAELGRFLLEHLGALKAKHPIIKEIRGRGLFVGIEFAAPSGLLTKAVPGWVRDELYSQVICALLLRDHALLTQPCSLAGNVLRVEPPLTITREEIEDFVQALDAALAACPSHNAAAIAAFMKTLLGKEL